MPTNLTRLQRIRHALNAMPQYLPGPHRHQSSMTLRFMLALNLLTCVLLTPVAAANPELPHYAATQHQGVATCASSFCHGSTQPRGNNNVLQNEYTTWSREDAHSRAYQTLQTQESQRIARKLGLKDAATAKVCLDCHTDNVPTSLQGEKFQISDGVGCEACHGGAENWIASHVDGNADHQANIDQGLYPTDDPAARAKLCMSCHIGTPEKFATHDIMGAGHPRLSFELTTFSALQPMHYQVDDDYAERKTATDDATLWALGQLHAAQQTADNLASSKLLGRGLFPELSLFDCHACHHAMNQQRWAPGSTRPALGTGNIRVNDSQLTLVRPILAYYDLPLAKKYLRRVQRVHSASLESRGNLVSAAKRLSATLDEAIALISQTPITAEDSLGIMQQLSWRGASGQYRDYAAAEHAAMGIQVLAVNAGIVDQIQGELDKLFKALGNENAYAPFRANRAFQAMDKRLKAL